MLFYRQSNDFSENRLISHVSMESTQTLFGLLVPICFGQLIRPKSTRTYFRLSYPFWLVCTCFLQLVPYIKQIFMLRTWSLILNLDFNTQIKKYPICIRGIVSNGNGILVISCNEIQIFTDLTTTFTMRGIFPNCPISMYLHFQSLVNVNLDLMVYGKRVMTNVDGALQ